jgi:hypothetical protein
MQLIPTATDAIDGDGRGEVGYSVHVNYLFKLARRRFLMFLK